MMASATFNPPPHHHRHHHGRRSSLQHGMTAAHVAVVIVGLLLVVIASHHTCNATAIAAPNRIQDQITKVSMDIADWAGTNEVATLGDLTGDAVDEIAVGSQDQRRVAIVKLNKKDSAGDAQVVTLVHGSMYLDAGTGDKFGKAAAPLKSDFNGDSTVDIIISAPQNNNWAAGRFVILCLGSDLKYVTHFVYSPANWCNGCTQAAPFAHHVFSFKYGNTACLTVIGGWSAADSSIIARCGMTKENPAGTVYDIKVSTSWFVYYRFLQDKSFIVLGDINSDGVEELVYMEHYQDSTYYYDVIWWKPGVSWTEDDNVIGTATPYSPMIPGAPGDINQDGIADLAYTFYSTIYFVHLLTTGLPGTSFQISVAGENIGRSVTFARRGMRYTLYMYYIVPAKDTISSFYLGKLWPAPPETETPTPTPTATSTPTPTPTAILPAKPVEIFVGETVESLGDNKLLVTLPPVGAPPVEGQPTSSVNKPTFHNDGTTTLEVHATVTAKLPVVPTKDVTVTISVPSGPLPMTNGVVGTVEMFLESSAIVVITAGSSGAQLDIPISLKMIMIYGVQKATSSDKERKALIMAATELGTTSFSCASEDPKYSNVAGSVTVQMQLPTVPPNPNVCAWGSAVGFNPWSRWNAFATTGATNLFSGSVVQGRVASVGAVTVHQNSEVHSVKRQKGRKEQKIRDTKWSVTSADTITLQNGAKVKNGGVEAATAVVLNEGSSVAGNALCVTDGGVEKNELATLEGQVIDSGDARELSADLTKSVTYFEERSQTWKALGTSYISASPITAGVLRLRVHGRVNVVNDIDATELATISQIVLEGHAMGTVIFNVASSGTLPNSNEVNLPQGIDVQHEKDGVQTPVGFGRVLVNFYEATVVMYAPPASAAVGTSTLSVLAPLAAITLEAGAIVKGNVIGASLSVAGGAEVHPQAFGMLLRDDVVSPRAPKPGNYEFRRSWECMWATL